MDVLKHKKLYFVIVGTLLFNYLFWHAPFGINALLFSLFGIASLFILYPETKKSKVVLVSTLGHFLTAVFVVIHNSGVSILAWHITFVLMVGFVNQPSLRSILFALPTSLGNFFRFPFAINQEFPNRRIKLSKLKAVARYIRIALMPLFLLFIFYWIFRFANPIFNDYSLDVMEYIGDTFEAFFASFSMLRVLFIVLGFALSGWIVFKADISRFVTHESKLADIILRIRKTKKKETHPISDCEYPSPQNPHIEAEKLSLALKSEYRAALFLTFTINLLLLIVNGIDISWIWFNFEYEPGFNLKQFVHEGTYLLILSILLSMAILLIYFRRNLNFYPKQKFLKALSFAWLAQNGILAISVGLRNYHYIAHYGLAYKRIGVIFFLLLVIFGLITLYIKIRDRKSAFFLWRTNTWAVYALLIVLSTINWDVVIARHNLAHNYEHPIDIRFLLSLSDKTLAIVDRNSKVLTDNGYSNIYERGEGFSYPEYFEIRKQRFIIRKEKEGWQSWNLAEQRVLEYFQKE